MNEVVCLWNIHLIIHWVFVEDELLLIRSPWPCCTKKKNYYVIYRRRNRRLDSEWQSNQWLLRTSAISDLFPFFSMRNVKREYFRKRINNITHSIWIDSLIICCVGEDCHDYGDCKDDVIWSGDFTSTFDCSKIHVKRNIIEVLQITITNCTVVLNLSFHSIDD